MKILHILIFAIRKTRISKLEKEIIERLTTLNEKFQINKQLIFCFIIIIILSVH